MKFFTLCISTLLFSNIAFADITVIVHPSNNTTIDENSIARIFTGKLKSFPGGGQAVPVNQIESSSVTNEFNSNVLKKSSSQLKAYWSKLVFTGKGNPPTEAANDAEVIKLISANPNLIGYISSGSLDGSVKSIGSY